MKTSIHAQIVAKSDSILCLLRKHKDFELGRFCDLKYKDFKVEVYTDSNKPTTFFHVAVGKEWKNRVKFCRQSLNYSCDTTNINYNRNSVLTWLTNLNKTLKEETI